MINFGISESYHTFHLFVTLCPICHIAIILDKVKLVRPQPTNTEALVTGNGIVLEPGSLTARCRHQFRLNTISDRIASERPPATTSRRIHSPNCHSLWLTKHSIRYETSSMAKLYMILLLHFPDRHLTRLHYRTSKARSLLSSSRQFSSSFLVYVLYLRLYHLASSNPLTDRNLADLVRRRLHPTRYQARCLPRSRRYRVDLPRCGTGVALLQETSRQVVAGGLRIRSCKQGKSINCMACL